MIKKRIYIVVLFLLSTHCMVLPIVNGEDFTCKPGYSAGSGDTFTSGDPSQVCGKAKITTAEECEAAAEYNRKTNI